ncbi:hypothetical protein, partial [Bradyrhizobium sp.]|uniref:hypothetical protein n=1 Tax=Bradyrhizobium sp. TaxID=376 RepID=UPI0040384BBD
YPFVVGCERCAYPIRFCLLYMPPPGRRLAVMAYAAKRGCDSASLYGLTPVRFTACQQQASTDLVTPHLTRASDAIQPDQRPIG